MGKKGVQEHFVKKLKRFISLFFVFVCLSIYLFIWKNIKNVVNVTQSKVPMIFIRHRGVVDVKNVFLKSQEIIKGKKD